MNGTTYKPGMAVFLAYNHYMPEFGQIKEILMIEDKTYLATLKFVTEVFNSHFNSYEVALTSSWHICEVASLLDHHPLWAYQSYDIQLSDHYFIPLKYYVLSPID